MGKRILVLSAAVGAGHLRAAEAVTLALRETAPAGSMVENVDVLTLTNAAFRRLYGKAYLDLVNHAPHLLGYFYDLLDRPHRRNAGDEVVSLAKRLNLRRFTELLTARPWDAIVSTHFLPAELVAGLRRKGKIDVPQVLVTTDFETHRLWVQAPVERYTTATAEGKAYLATFGVPAESIAVTGIPIHPDFSRPPTRAAALAAQGLTDDRPVILQLAGGFGVGPIERLYRGLLALGTPAQVVVVCGKNDKVRRQLEAVAVPDRHAAHVLGYTNQMPELLAAADLVVTKPGGLTTSEVLASGAAMAIVNPIPGQESRNSDYLLEEGAAVKINNLATMGLKLGPLLADASRLKALQDNARRLGRPRAAYDVAEIVLGLAR